MCSEGDDPTCWPTQQGEKPYCFTETAPGSAQVEPCRSISVPRTAGAARPRRSPWLRRRSAFHPTRPMPDTAVGVGFGARRAVPVVEAECRLSAQKGDHRRKAPQWARRVTGRSSDEGNRRGWPTASFGGDTRIVPINNLWWPFRSQYDPPGDRSRRGPQMRATPDSMFTTPERLIADLQRQLAEREVELAECKAERHEAV